jgi:D-alanine transaminase
MSESMLYLNGRYMPLEEGRVSVEDRGFQFGDGVYEAIKVLNGALLWCEEHLSRLAVTLRAVRMEGAAEGHDLASVLPRLVELAALTDGLVYLQVTRGAGPRDFFFPEAVTPTVLAYARDYAFPGQAEILAGICLHIVPDFRWARCDIKAVTLLPAVLAKQEARERGCREALWVGDGVAREGASSNFFAVLDGVLRTHPADHRVLNGITRQTVLRLAGQLDIPVREEAVALKDLDRLDEAFIASTTNDVMPVVAIDSRAVSSGSPGLTTLALSDAVRAEAAVLAGLDLPRPFVAR